MVRTEEYKGSRYKYSDRYVGEIQNSPGAVVKF
jgi:hypothetical protein